MTKPVRITFDMKEWDTQWGANLIEAVKVEKSEFGITIELDMDSEIFNKAPDKIAKEAVEKFIDDFFTCFTFSDEGVTLAVLEQGDDNRAVVPWDNMACRQNAETFDAMATFVAKKRKQWENDLADHVATHGPLGPDEELYEQ